VVVVVPTAVPPCSTVYFVIVQPLGGVTAFQLRLVLESVVPEAANPVGALGLVVHELARVVTFTAELAADVPDASVASTVKV
jgi:hypothetical protein